MFGVMLMLLLVFVALAGVTAIVSAQRQTQTTQTDKAPAVEIEMPELPSSAVRNPAYAELDVESREDVRVLELEEELASLKREHSKYTSAHIAAELKKVQVAHEAELLAERQARERSAAEAEELRMELALLKKVE